MRSLVLASLAIALAASSPAMAQPSDLSDRLHKYCIDTRSNADAALRLARADGFVAPPQSMLAGLPRVGENMRVVWAVYEGGLLMLLTGVGDDVPSRHKGDVCAVATMGVDRAAVAAFETWLGAKTPSGVPVYFAEEGAARRIIKQSDRAALTATSQAGALRLVGTQLNAQLTMLMYVSLRP